MKKWVVLRRRSSRGFVSAVYVLREVAEPTDASTTDNDCESVHSHDDHDVVVDVAH